MGTDQRYEQAIEKLEKYGQGHLLGFYDELDEVGKEALLNQIDDLDFSRIPDWVERYVKNDGTGSVPADFSPPPVFDPTDCDSNEERKLSAARERGIELLNSGKAAAFIVAGGQGTRLGFDGPKGDFPVSPVKGKSLFQLFADQILAARRRYNAAFPWYIMTSELNYDATVRIFNENDYFGLSKADVMIFRQGTLPNFDFEGKIFLADKGHIARSPNGHGGSLKALYDSGAIADMRTRGIEHISYFQVDNPLINIFDPLFIGLHAVESSDMSSKALTKREPKEKVGVFCEVDGRIEVIEYSDLPDEEAAKRNEDGSLVFELGSIAIHIISREFVHSLNAEGFSLPIHRAVKKIPHINDDGVKVSPDASNGVKLETFVFDALPLAEKSIILKTQRDEEFAPVKNAEGSDSPSTARAAMVARACRRLEAAGVEVPRKADGSFDCVVEISPLFALDVDELREKKDSIPAIKSGDEVYLG